MKQHRMVAIGIFLVILVAFSAGTSIIGGPIAHENLKNGTDDGTAGNGPVNVKARVTISNQKIKPKLSAVS